MSQTHSPWGDAKHSRTHLYRRHTMPLQCPRCWTTFKTDALLTGHLQQDPPCNICPNETLAEGFTKDQEKKLRSRKKTSAEMTDEDKWREIYTILFPDDDPETIPSACEYPLVKFQGSAGNLTKAINRLRDRSPRRDSTSIRV